MPVPVKSFFLLIAFSAIFLFSPGVVFAQVVINEILPDPTDGSDWIELYNTTNQDVDLNGWIVDDEGTKTNMLEIGEITIGAHAFWFSEVGSRLNKGGDTIYLINNQGLTVDEYQYTASPGLDISLGRMPDGGDWGTCDPPTPEAENQCIIPTPIPTPSSTPTPEPEEESEEESVSPTSAPTSSPTPTPKAVKVIGATLSGEVLGKEEASQQALYPWEATEGGEEEGEATSVKKSISPLIFLGLGLVFLSAAAYRLWYTFYRKGMTKGKDEIKEKSKIID
jgi:hypothetical protein